MLRIHKIFEVRLQPKRRVVLVAAAGCTLGVLPISVRAQTKKAPAVIGWLHNGSPESGARDLASFREGLAAAGLKDGEQIVIEQRWLRGRPDLATKLAAELVSSKPAVIVTSPGGVTAATAKAASGVPIVQSTGGSLVSAGLAASLQRPGGMVTGLVSLAVDTIEKRIEIVRDLIPKVERIGYLVDPNAIDTSTYIENAKRASSHFKVQAIFCGGGTSRGTGCGI